MTEDFKETLREHGLRATAPRVAVLRELCDAGTPLSHTEVLARLGDVVWDPATIYRNLVKLTEAGLTQVVSRAEGMARYALVTTLGDHAHDHEHPHFVCDECGKVSCLPIAVTTSADVDERWAASVRRASVQLLGSCPDCIDVAETS